MATTLWRCQRDGACCLQPATVTMSIDECRLIIQRRPDDRLLWRRRADGMMELLAKPCPLAEVDKASGHVHCTVYDIRPYNCRRFQCGRHDPKVEPFAVNPLPLISKDRILRRSYAINQRKAQRWGREHGWTPEGLHAASIAAHTNKKSEADL